MKAIPTEYNGYHFRSRLEATWACFFNNMNMPYQYEPKVFNLDGVKYLPDFWLPHQQVWIEIKPTFVLAGRAFEKLDMLADRTDEKVVLFYEGVSRGMSGLRFLGNGEVEPGYRWSADNTGEIWLARTAGNSPRVGNAAEGSREFMISGPMEDDLRAAVLNPWSHPNAILPDRNQPDSE